MSVDKKWEFDAPQFVDFSNFELENDGADEYFGTTNKCLVLGNPSCHCALYN